MIFPLPSFCPGCFSTLTHFDLPSSREREKILRNFNGLKGRAAMIVRCQAGAATGFPLSLEPGAFFIYFRGGG